MRAKADERDVALAEAEDVPLPPELPDELEAADTEDADIALVIDEADTEELMLDMDAEIPDEVDAVADIPLLEVLAVTAVLSVGSVGRGEVSDSIGAEAEKGGSVWMLKTGSVPL